MHLITFQSCSLLTACCMHPNLSSLEAAGAKLQLDASVHGSPSLLIEGEYQEIGTIRHHVIDNAMNRSATYSTISEASQTILEGLLKSGLGLAIRF